MLELTVGDIGSKTVLKFEHSLLSVSKWEEVFNKPFQSMQQKTNDEMLAYYRMMLLSPEDQQDLVYTLKPDQFDIITKYMNSIPGPTKPPARDDDAPRFTGEVVTADIIYMRMTLLRIPWQPAETWHFNRLMLQIALVADAQKPPKKEKPGGLLQKWSDINQKNRDFFKSNG